MTALDFASACAARAEQPVAPRYVESPQLVPLAKLLAEVAPAYGSSWAAVTAALLADPAEFDVIEVLATELLESGAPSFTDPVRVESRHDEVEPDEEPLEPDDGTRWRIGNGMHRITATIIAGLDHVLVTSDVPDLAGERELEVRFTLDHSRATTPPPPWDSDHPDLDFLSWLRSFRLPDGSWVEQIFAGTSNRVVECVYSCRPDQVDAILTELVSRASAHEVELTLLDHVLRPADYWDDQDLGGL